MKEITIHDDLYKSAEMHGADIDTLVNRAINDLDRIVEIPPIIELSIEDSYIPLTNWARKIDNKIYVKFSSFNLDPTMRIEIIGGRRNTIIDKLDRDVRCSHILSHEIMEPLRSKVPFMENVMHNNLGVPFEIGDNEEGLVHSSQLTISDVVTDKPLIVLRTQATGFLSAHRQFYYIDKQFIDCLDTARSGNKLLVNKDPFKISRTLLSSCRRAYISQIIRDRYTSRTLKNKYCWIGNYRCQFFRLVDKLKFSQLVFNGRNIYREFYNPNPQWKVVKAELDNILNHMEYSENF